MPRVRRQAAAARPSAVELVSQQRIEQDDRRIKQRIRAMLGFKRFDNAAVTIRGIELVQKIQKHPFKTGKLGGSAATMPELSNAVLAA